MKVRRAIVQISHHGVEVAAIGTAGVGLFALGTWVFDQWRLSAFGPEYVPMAPSTAVLFVLLGLAMGACHRWPDVRPLRIFGVVSAIVTMVVSALVVAQSWSYFSLPWDGWLMHPDLRAGAIPLGRMSPLTTAAFLLSAGSLLIRVPGPPGTRLLRWSAALAAGAALLVGLVIALGYFSGTPLFYGGQAVPMALLTAIAFVVLNLGLLLFNGTVFCLLDWFSLGLDSDVSETQRRFVSRLLTISAALVLAISLTGFFYLKRQETTARADVYSNLNAIADLKMAQIVNWRNERLRDGSFLAHAHFVARDMAVLLADPNSEAACAEVIAWLSLVKAEGLYGDAMIYDAAMNLQLALPGSTATRTPDPVLREHLATALRSNDAFLTDLHRDASGPIHLDLIVPVIPSNPAPPATSPPSTLSRPAPIAVIVLQIDSEKFLLPFVQSWPTPSQTAETLLVRREGEEVVYLSELRHQPGTTLILRRSIHELQLPAAMGARGETSVREGVDYRGVKVLTTTRAIPDSPWLMVAKVDQTEIYAPLRAEAWRAGLVIAALLLAVAATAAFLWRHNTAGFLHRTLVAEQERQIMADRLALVTRHANDIILLFDETWRIVEANDRALAAYGYTFDELHQLPSGGLRPLAAQENLPQQRALFGSPDGAVFETVHRRRDGTTFPVEVSGRSVEIAGRQFALGIYRDLTERKQAEAARRRAEEQYRSIFENAVEGIYQTTPQGTFLAANPAMARILGYASPDELIRERTDIARQGYVDPHRREEFKHRIEADGVVSGFEYEVYRRDGSKVWVSEDARAVRDEHGQVVYYEGSLDDITARKQAEAALRESERRYQMLADVSPVGIFRTDAQGQTTYVNPQWSQMSGLSAPDALGDGWLRAVHPRDRAELVQGWQVATQAPRTSKADYRFVRPDGTICWVMGQAVPESDQEGRIVGYVGTITDVTERKRAEDALRESEERFVQFMRNLPALTYIKDHARRIVFVNEHVGQIFDITAADWLGKVSEEIWPGEIGRKIREEDERVLGKREVVAGIHEMPTKDGQRVFRTIKFPIPRGQQPPMLGGVSLDVTEIRQAEEEVRLLNAELEQRVHDRTAALEAANQELEAFSYSVSHDLRAPLRAMSEFSQAVLDDFGPQLPAEALRQIQIIRGGAKRMGLLIDDLLDFARLSRQPLNKRTVDMAQLVRDCLAELEADRKERRTEVRVTALPPGVGDAAMLKQVWINLLANALKFTRGRDPAIIEIGTRREGATDVYFVRDNGTGFNMQYAHKLFGVFQRLHRTEDFEGTGVGLAIVQRIVHRHGGRVWAEAAVDHGATFFFTLEKAVTL